MIMLLCIILCSSYFVAELLFLACLHFVAKRYSEPPDRLIAMLEGFFDHFCAQFPEALIIKLIPRVYFPWYTTMLLLLPFHPSLNGPFKNLNFKFCYSPR